MYPLDLHAALAQDLDLKSRLADLLLDIMDGRRYLSARPTKQRSKTTIYILTHGIYAINELTPQKYLRYIMVGGLLVLWAI